MALDQSALLEVLDALRTADAGERITQAAETIYQALIDAELTAFIGASPHERTETRSNQRNGSRPRTLSTVAGDLELRIPKLRTGSFFPALLERRRRVDQCLFAVVMEAYLHGTSSKADWSRAIAMFLSVVILGRFTTETHAMALLRQGPTRRHHLHHSPGRSHAICRQNGIDHLLTQPRSPTTTGKIERFHRSLRAEFLSNTRAFSNLKTAQQALDEWVHYYNTARPHQSLNMTTPAERFTATASPVSPGDDVPASIDRDGQDWVSRRVTTNGVVSVAWQQVCVGAHYAGARCDVHVDGEL
ncbi:transposase, partial [Mycobacterium avium]|uniref:transposase n=1 Tax=Mycobacterium avium TaxID=1764 RepID=UPI001E4D3F03